MRGWGTHSVQAAQCASCRLSSGWQEPQARGHELDLLHKKWAQGPVGKSDDQTERDTAEAEDSAGRTQTFMPTDYGGIWYPFLEALSLSCSCVTASWINCFKDARETQPAIKSDLTVWLWWVYAASQAGHPWAQQSHPLRWSFSPSSAVPGGGSVATRMPSEQSDRKVSLYMRN